MPIRWNSTYKLLQNITKYKKVVQIYEIQLSNHNCDVGLDVSNDYNWHIVDLLRDIFEIFYASTNFILFFVVCIILLHTASLCK